MHKFDLIDNEAMVHATQTLETFKVVEGEAALFTFFAMHTADRKQQVLAFQCTMRTPTVRVLFDMPPQCRVHTAVRVAEMDWLPEHAATRKRAHPTQNATTHVERQGGTRILISAMMNGGANGHAVQVTAPVVIVMDALDDPEQLLFVPTCGADRWSHQVFSANTDVYGGHEDALSSSQHWGTLSRATRESGAVLPMVSTMRHVEVVSAENRPLTNLYIMTRQMPGQAVSLSGYHFYDETPMRIVTFRPWGMALMPLVGGCYLSPREAAATETSPHPRTFHLTDVYFAVDPSDPSRMVMTLPNTEPGAVYQIKPWDRHRDAQGASYVTYRATTTLE